MERSVEFRLRLLETKVDVLLQHLGIDPASIEADAGDSRFTEVRDLKERGKTVAAVQLYRDLTGEGLAEAKQAVESMD